jgi:DNA polymerase-4
MRRYGSMGQRLHDLAHGRDARRVSARAPVKSISNETTFHEDLSDAELLEGHLWRLAEKVSDRAKAKENAGRVVTLKLKCSNHKLISRRHSLHEPTQMVDRIFREAMEMLKRELPRGPFRLIGVGLSQIEDASEADTSHTLLDAQEPKRFAVERATDEIRNRFGNGAIVKGRALR